MSRTLQMALDVLDAITDDVDGTGLNTMPSFDKALDAIAALREALAAPEPVAEVFDTFGNSQDQNKAVGHVRLKAHYFPPKGTKLYAAPPAAPASQWMPIETAPKDSLYEDGENRYGRRILVWGRGYDEPMRARWWHRADSGVSNFIADGGFAVFPTHWMPLPAAPDHFRDVAEKVAPAAPVPDGWVMVPREPTEDMIQAAAGAWGESEGGLHNAFAAALRGGITASPAAHVVREPRHVRKVGGSFQHTGTVVAEFRTTTGEPRIVIEFDAPVAGMLHVYRPDQVEDTIGGSNG